MNLNTVFSRSQLQVIFHRHHLRFIAVTSLMINVNQPLENRLTFNSRLAHITCNTKLINTVARVVRAHLDFYTSWGQTQ